MDHDQNVVPKIPALDGDPIYITGYPELGELSHQPPEHEIVDHAIWQSADGKWHCWACIRKTVIGRLFYGWEGDSLEQPNWKPVGVTMRADRSRGESVNDWGGEEYLQAPHVILHDGKYWMFYGGHNTELGESQICLATSQDGRCFERYENELGYSRLFVGPGSVRDPMVLRVGDQWVCYLCGNDKDKRRPNKVYARTSQDLVHWSETRDVSWGGFISSRHTWSCECPFVIFKDGFYYLFRTSEYYAPARTHVYRSQDPFDFGVDTDQKWVATLRVAAPEVVQVGDQLFISSVENMQGGIQLFKLKWI